jgi:hypothetical protein
VRDALLLTEEDLEFHVLVALTKTVNVLNQLELLAEEELGQCQPATV